MQTLTCTLLWAMQTLWLLWQAILLQPSHLLPAGNPSVPSYSVFPTTEGPAKGCMGLAMSISPSSAARRKWKTSVRVSGQREVCPDEQLQPPLAHFGDRKCVIEESLC